MNKSLIGFDEMTPFTEAQYRYLLSRVSEPRDLAYSTMTDPAWERLRACYGLAGEYAARCDDFDRKVAPNGRPRTYRETAIMGRHAVKVYRELLAEAVGLGFSAQEFRNAVRNTTR